MIRLLIMEDWRLTCDLQTGVPPLGAFGVHVEQTDVAALVLPGGAPQADGGGVQRRPGELHLPPVRRVHLLPEAAAEGGQVLNGLVLKRPLPGHLLHT